VRYYLITYNRGAGRVEKLVPFGETERAEALRQRFELEQARRNDSNIEVVVIGAESEEVLRVTHARYFKTPQELVGG